MIAPHPISDSRMIREIWPLLLAAALGLVPFTIFSTFLVGIGAAADRLPEEVGALRGLGGIAALIVGIAVAPLLDRISRRHLAGLSMLALAAACLIGTIGPMWTWVVFCLVVGAATATLNPAISAMAADSFADEAASGRAATMVSATTTLAAMLAAPLLAGPALIWGWRGDLVATAVLCLLVAAAQLLPRRGADRAVNSGAQIGYLDRFRIAARVPGALPLLGISTLRTAAFMGQLAYIAVYYDRFFGLGPGPFSLIWTLSGFSFFLGNWCAGKALRAFPTDRLAVVVMLVATLVGTASILGLFTAPALWVAAAMTSVTAICHAVIAACVTTLLVRRAAGSRGAVLALNGAGQSLGVFAGAALAAAGLALHGWLGMGGALAVVTAAAVLLALPLLRRTPVETPVETPV